MSCWQHDHENIIFIGDFNREMIIQVIYCFCWQHRNQQNVSSCCEVFLVGLQHSAAAVQRCVWREVGFPAWLTSALVCSPMWSTQVWISLIALVKLKIAAESPELTVTGAPGRLPLLQLRTSSNHLGDTSLYTVHIRFHKSVLQYKSKCIRSYR